MKGTSPFLKYLAAIIMVFGTYLIGYEVPRSDFTRLISVFFIICLGGYFFWKNNFVKEGLIVAVLVRLVLLFSTPSLSDDCYRYIWDGYCSINGIHPFANVPSELVKQKIVGLDDQLLHQFNSPNYFSVYPLVLQIIFAISAFLGKGNNFLIIILMKVFFVLFEFGAIYFILKLLKKLGKASRNVLLFALHPIVFIETVGNLHAEGIMVFFVIASVYFLYENKNVYSALLFSLSVATKMLPLLFLPMFFTFLKGKGRWMWVFSTIVFSILLFSPLLIPQIFKNIGNSIGLYYHQFEFNASFYYVFKSIQHFFWGIRAPRLVGTLLIIPTIFYSVVYFFKNIKKQNVRILEPALYVFTIYLLGSAIVHPWYIILPIAISIFTSYRYPIFWGVLIFLTYIHYSVYKEYEYLVLILEYVMVIGLIMVESSKNRQLDVSKSVSK